MRFRVLRRLSAGWPFWSPKPCSRGAREVSGVRPATRRPPCPGEPLAKRSRPRSLEGRGPLSDEPWADCVAGLKRMFSQSKRAPSRSNQRRLKSTIFGQLCISTGGTLRGCLLEAGACLHGARILEACVAGLPPRLASASSPLRLASPRLASSGPASRGLPPPALPLNVLPPSRLAWFASWLPGAKLAFARRAPSRRAFPRLATSRPEARARLQNRNLPPQTMPPRRLPH